jgi:hypothetical protein
MSVAREVEAKELVANWASQTIAFAISIRAEETGKKLEDPKSRQLVASGAWDQASDLWEATLREASNDADTAALMLAYSRKVLSWCHGHINR